MDPERDRQKLRRWCIRRLQEDWPVRKVSEHVSIPKSTIHEWWSRFQRKGWEGLLNESRRPHTIHRLPEATVQRIVEIRQREGRCHEAIAFLDDCSRYVPAASLRLENTTDTVLETLEEALSAGRIPKQILSDHGTQYWSNDGPGKFTNFCMKHGIEHILGSTGKPTTQGKIERFFQTFELYYPS